MKLFDSVSGRGPRYNNFNLSHERKVSFNMADIIPVVCNEVVPGDRFRINSECFIRFAPMLAPIMHRINVSVHYFFVPNRLIWDEWEEFITGGADGMQEPVHPKIQITDTTKTYFDKGFLNDYFGLPVIPGTTTVTEAMNINALPFRAYQEIWNEYYRDQNLSDPNDYTHDSGTITTTGEIIKLLYVKKRCWQKDYFTSALPWTQRGGEVSLPLDVNLKPIAQFKDTTGADYSGGNVRTFEHSTTGQLRDTTDNVSGNLETIDSIEATINNLRTATRLQEWLEKNARAGSRYIEVIKSHFNVSSSDKRLQRPEYLGGGMNPVVISEVLNTSATGTEEQGYMSGHGVSAGRIRPVSKRFEEHGFVMGLMSVMPRTAYQQGIPRWFNKADRYDYYWPEFANLGEQQVQEKELFYDGTNATKNDVFGYQSRYAEYKYHNDIVSGDFRDNLAYWQLGRIFGTRPQLSEAFVTADPSDRIFAVTDPNYHKLYGQIYNRISALRPMPYFGTPRL